MKVLVNSYEPEMPLDESSSVSKGILQLNYTLTRKMPLHLVTQQNGDSSFWEHKIILTYDLQSMQSSMCLKCGTIWDLAALTE